MLATTKVKFIPQNKRIGYFVLHETVNYSYCVLLYMFLFVLICVFVCKSINVKLLTLILNEKYRQVQFCSLIVNVANMMSVLLYFISKPVKYHSVMLNVCFKR